jgi:anti-sigma factor RsiW
MLLNYLRYRYVKTRMNAYLDGELPLTARRFIARQIDENPLCYRDYIRAKQSKQELERSLPTVGQVQAGQLDNLWATIQAELNQPENSTTRTNPRPSYSLSYGVAMLILAIIMLAPFAIDASRMSVSPVPQHPLPEETALLTSPASTPDAHPRAIALVVDTAVQVQSTHRSGIPLQNTPAPHTPGR